MTTPAVRAIRGSEDSMTEASDSPVIQTLYACRFPLHGSRLIEASAGTGKTYTIAALYLRLVLGHGNSQAFSRPLSPSEILVMTFTRAATRELSDRIRERLIEAARCFRGEGTPKDDDSTLLELLADYPDADARSAAAWRLATAAEGMDDAAVFTIDAWCQRMLREHAFDSGSLFDEALAADEDAMRIEASQDYWRQQCYPMDEAQLGRLLEVWPGVDALIQDMRALVDREIDDPAAAEPLAVVLDQCQSLLVARNRSLKAGWDLRAREMQDWILAQKRSDKGGWNGTKLRDDYVEGWISRLQAWVADETALTRPDLATGWRRLTPAGLLEARKQPFSGTIPPVFQEFADLDTCLDHLPDTRTPVRRHAATWVAQRIAYLKRQSGTFGFDDMLRRLEAALGGDAGERLRDRIVAEYPVALIDEFQDTSPRQYRIFDKIYRTATNDPTTALLLIGDPKQSIYGFRGADIYSYLSARRATAGRHYVLETNYRSTKSLVQAVNHWFRQVEDASGPGAFMFRSGADNPVPFLPVHASGRTDRLIDAAGDVPALEIVYSAELASASAIHRRFGELCAQRIVDLLNDRSAGFASEGGPLTPVRPADIAVLVRTGVEASAVRRALRRRGVASVYLSDKDSVFASDEARDLLRWLRAVAMPADVRLARAGLATELIGFDLGTLAAFAADDEAFDQQAEQLRELLVVWQVQGILAMLRQTLHRFDLPAKWLVQANGERRLTNILHLAELLQTASTALDGEQALIRWLAGQLQDTGSAADEQIVRLESDADLVKVVTIHKSKGLEYPYVLLPFVTCHRPVDANKARYLEMAGDEGQRRLLLKFSDDDLAAADRERLREDLRLLYVGLTRARHGLWIGFSALKIGNGSACQAHRSAAGYLIGGGQAWPADAWGPRINAFVEGLTVVRTSPAPSETGMTPLQRSEERDRLQPVVAYTALFDRNWSINSFSALVRDKGELAPRFSLAQAERPADDEVSVADVTHSADLPAPDGEPGLQFAVGSAMPSMPARPSSPRHGFVRGALAGNFLHDQLEWLAGEQFALADHATLAERLSRRCERAGYQRHAADIVAWLKDVVSTPLRGPNVSLAGLDRVIPEMEFWLPARDINVHALDRLCREHLLDDAPRSALADREVHGMLMGYADLVFEHEGRFWVLDYKSNSLGHSDADYDFARLRASMADHRYDMQAAIYLAALHRLLRSRLGAQYDPARHLGGAVYLYLRGIDGPERGVFLVTPAPALLDGIEAMLGPLEGQA